MANYVLVDANQLDADLASVADSIRAKGETTDQLAFPDAFVSAINAISKGVVIQRKSGSFTTNYAGSATVNCGFKPDFVALDGNAVTNGYTAFSGVPFQESGSDSVMIFHHPSDSQSYIASIIGVARTETGFSVSAQRMSTSLAFSNDTYRTIKYIAVKYTE